MPKPLGTKNFSPAEAQRLTDLVAQGLTRPEAAEALGRSYWVVMRHGKRLGLTFARHVRPRRAPKPVVNKRLADARARRRQLEDQLIEELARNGWSQGTAALELDLDFSQLGRHSKRLGVIWKSYPNRSQKGAPVAGVAELRGLRSKMKRLTKPA